MGMHIVSLTFGGPEIQGDGAVERGAYGKTQAATTYGIGGRCLSTKMSAGDFGFHGLYMRYYC